MTQQQAKALSEYFAEVAKYPTHVFAENVVGFRYDMRLFDEFVDIVIVTQHSLFIHEDRIRPDGTMIYSTEPVRELEPRNS